MITQAYLKSVLIYDQYTGIFTWAVDRRGGTKAGTPAGSLTDKGYVAIGGRGTRSNAHRLAWLYMTGEWPTNQIDHVNGIRSDNRWSNLRQATSFENSRNRRNRKNNSSGVKGVIRYYNRWVAQVECNGVNYRYSFVTKDAAERCAKALRKELHGEFAHNGEN